MPVLAPLEMSVAAGDGLVLKGTLSYPERYAGLPFPLAVLAHQYPSTRDSLGPLAADLLDMGVAVLAFDLRGHGASIAGPEGLVVIDTPLGFDLPSFGEAFGSSAAKVGFHLVADDILRVAAWGATQSFLDRERLLLVGASIGGTGALLAAPAVAGLRGVLTLGAAGAPVHGGDGPRRVRESVERLSVPVLLLSSKDDPFQCAANAEAWSRGIPHAAARIVSGSAHGTGIWFDVRDEAHRFVRRALSIDEAA
jgi:dienelactone hydrolase